MMVTKLSPIYIKLNLSQCAFVLLEVFILKNNKKNTLHYFKFYNYKCKNGGGGQSSKIKVFFFFLIFKAF